MIRTTKKGDDIYIKDMETIHIQNCIALLERRAEKGVDVVYDLGWCYDDNFKSFETETLYGEEYLLTTVYSELKEELEKRKNIL